MKLNPSVNSLIQDGNLSTTDLDRLALIALANRTQYTECMRPNYGADGDYGSETQNAMKAFQKDSGLEVTRKVDARTAKALKAALKATNAPAVSGPGGQDNRGKRRVAGTEFLVREHHDHSGVDDPWVNIDPNHSLPANFRLGGLQGSWKCNLFAGNAMVQAGFEPPYYGDRGKGEYSNANQLFKWSDKHAGRHNNEV